VPKKQFHETQGSFDAPPLGRGMVPAIAFLIIVAAAAAGFG